MLNINNNQVLFKVKNLMLYTIFPFYFFPLESRNFAVSDTDFYEALCGIYIDMSSN